MSRKKSFMRILGPTQFIYNFRHDAVFSDLKMLATWYLTTDWQVKLRWYAFAMGINSGAGNMNRLESCMGQLAWIHKPRKLMF